MTASSGWDIINGIRRNVRISFENCKQRRGLVMNTPNKISILRILMVPVFMIFLMFPFN